MSLNINPKEAHKWLSSGDAVLIDVREPDEFSAQHISYALSLPLSSLDENFKSLDIPANKKIIFQCLKGARGEKACVLINKSDQCSNEIYNIEGGISAWEDAGLPIIGRKGPPLSIFRQVQIIVGGMITLLVLLGLSGFKTGFILAGVLGFALCFAGISGWCGLALLLSKMPWNNR